MNVLPTVNIWDFSWNIHLRPSSSVRLVPQQHRNLPQHVMEPPQRNCLDKEQTFPE